MHKTAQRILLRRHIGALLPATSMHNALPANLLHTQEREVTLLFSDLRRSTELAAAVQTDPLACEMIGHVLDSLTEAVLDHRGTVVDYYGDGLLAMWNAPDDEAAHAELACRAGLQMIGTLPDVTHDWIGLTECELQLGIGVHTGMVQVGNAGSTWQAKYGPRGPSVHVASRVEAATKELGLPLVATEATIKRFSDTLAANRVCRAELPGLREPIDLYAVHAPGPNQHVAAAWLAYDHALRRFEQGRLDKAAESLASIETNIITVPWRFLSREIQRELGRCQRRRSTDRPLTRNGVIALCAK